MAKIRLGDYCCQGGDRTIDTANFTEEELVLAQRDRSTLLFSPLGNRPAHPVLALVGITPGSQSEAFAGLLRTHDVTDAASKAAFAKSQTAIKALLQAHGFASRIGVGLEGDLNENPDILTTSLVKCCLKVDGAYSYKAPDISASPEASFCVTNRFVSELEQYPSLKWVVIFGAPGWEAVNRIAINGVPLRNYLAEKGLTLLNFPHFAQNFQQRTLFALQPAEEAAFLSRNSAYKSYAPAARAMREQLFRAIGNHDIQPQQGEPTVTKTNARRLPAVNDPVPASPDSTVQTDEGRFGSRFYLLHQSGDKLYPVRVRNKDTGATRFRVSPGGKGGNTKAMAQEVENENELVRYVFERGHAVRAATLNGSRAGLYKVGQRSIVNAVRTGEME